MEQTFFNAGSGGVNNGWVQFLGHPLPFLLLPPFSSNFCLTSFFHCRQGNAPGGVGGRMSEKRRISDIALSMVNDSKQQQQNGGRGRRPAARQPSASASTKPGSTRGQHSGVVEEILRRSFSNGTPGRATPRTPVTGGGIRARISTPTKSIPARPSFSTPKPQEEEEHPVVHSQSLTNMAIAQRKSSSPSPSPKGVHGWVHQQNQLQPQGRGSTSLALFQPEPGTPIAGPLTSSKGQDSGAGSNIIPPVSPTARSRSSSPRGILSGGSCASLRRIGSESMPRAGSFLGVGARVTFIGGGRYKGPQRWSDGDSKLDFGDIGEVTELHSYNLYPYVCTFPHCKVRLAAEDLQARRDSTPQRGGTPTKLSSHSIGTTGNQQKPPTSPPRYTERKEDQSTEGSARPRSPSPSTRLRAILDGADDDATTEHSTFTKPSRVSHTESQKDSSPTYSARIPPGDTSAGLETQSAGTAVVSPQGVPALSLTSAPSPSPEREKIDEGETPHLEPQHLDSPSAEVNASSPTPRSELTELTELTAPMDGADTQMDRHESESTALPQTSTMGSPQATLPPSHLQGADTTGQQSFTETFNVSSVPDDMSETDRMSTEMGTEGVKFSEEGDIARERRFSPTQWGSGALARRRGTLPQVRGEEVAEGNGVAAGSTHARAVSGTVQLMPQLPTTPTQSTPTQQPAATPQESPIVADEPASHTSSIVKEDITFAEEEPSSERPAQPGQPGQPLTQERLWEEMVGRFEVYGLDSARATEVLANATSDEEVSVFCQDALGFGTLDATRLRVMRRRRSDMPAKETGAAHAPTPSRGQLLNDAATRLSNLKVAPADLVAGAPASLANSLPFCEEVLQLTTLDSLRLLVLWSHASIPHPKDRHDKVEAEDKPSVSPKRIPSSAGNSPAESSLGHSERPESIPCLSILAPTTASHAAIEALVMENAYFDPSVHRVAVHGVFQVEPLSVDLKGFKEECKRVQALAEGGGGGGGSGGAPTQGATTRSYGTRGTLLFYSPPTVESSPTDTQGRTLRSRSPTRGATTLPLTHRQLADDLSRDGYLSFTTGSPLLKGKGSSGSGVVSVLLCEVVLGLVETPISGDEEVNTLIAPRERLVGQGQGQGHETTPDCLAVEYEYLTSEGNANGKARGKQYLVRTPALVLPRYRVDIRVTLRHEGERASPPRPPRLPPSPAYVPASPSHAHSTHETRSQTPPRTERGTWHDMCHYVNLPLSSALGSLVANIEDIERDVADRVCRCETQVESLKHRAVDGTQRSLRARRTIKSRFDMLARLLESKRNDLLERVDSRDKQRREALSVAQDEQNQLCGSYTHLLSLVSMVHREKMDRRASGLPPHATPSASLTQAVESLQLAASISRRDTTSAPDRHTTNITVPIAHPSDDPAQTPMRETPHSASLSPTSHAVALLDDDPVYEVDLIEVLKSIEDLDLVEGGDGVMLPPPPEPRLAVAPRDRERDRERERERERDPIPRLNGVARYASGSTLTSSAGHVMRTSSTASATTMLSVGSHSHHHDVRSVSPGRHTASPPHRPLSPDTFNTDRHREAPPRPSSLIRVSPISVGLSPNSSPLTRNPKKTWAPVMGDAVVCYKDAFFKNMADQTGAAKWHEALTIDGASLDTEGELVGPAGTSIATEWTLQFVRVEGSVEVGLFVVGSVDGDANASMEAEEDRLVAIPTECMSDPLTLVVRLTVRSGGRPPSLSIYALEGNTATSPETRLVTRMLAPFNLAYPYYAAAVLRGKGEARMVSPPTKQTNF